MKLAFILISDQTNHSRGAGEPGEGTDEIVLLDSVKVAFVMNSGLSRT